MTRHPVARIDLGAHADLVVSVCDDGQIDCRIWQSTGGVKLAGGQGFKIPKWAIRDLIAALKQAQGNARAPAPRRQPLGRGKAERRCC